MMLEIHRDVSAACTKAVFFSCRERHCTYLGQKVSARANHRLTEIASHSRCSSVRPEARRKEGEICCYLKGLKKSPVRGVDKKREEKFLLPLLLQKSKRGSKLQLSPAAWERRAKTRPTFSTHGTYASPPQPICLWVLQSSAKPHFHILHRPHHFLSVAAWTHASLT